MTEAVADKKDEKAPFITNDLKIIAEGAEKKITITDLQGKVHNLNPLVVGDMIEFEEEIGVSLIEIAKVELRIKHIIFLLYLSLRKEGCAREDLERRKFAYTRYQVGEMFDLGLLSKATMIISDLLSISGLKAENPQTPTSQKVTTPGEGSEKA